jgi:7-cyano-7-deazaguanine synthase in queuosine biosynthesis
MTKKKQSNEKIRPETKSKPKYGTLLKRALVAKKKPYKAELKVDAEDEKKDEAELCDAAPEEVLCDVESPEETHQFKSAAEKVFDRLHEVKPITKKFEDIINNAVVFSGGLDSTLILVDLLEKGIKPRLLSFRCEQFGTSHHYLSEVASQEKILEYLAKKYDYEPKRDFIKLEGNMDNWNGSEPSLFQQPFMASMVSLCGRNKTCYHFGYHKGDDFWNWSHNILAAQEHLLTVVGQKNIMFSYPLQFLTKADIIRNLNYRHFPIELCSFCYSPTYKGRCGHCVACQTYDKATSEIIHMSGTYNGMSNELYYPEGFIEEMKRNRWRD